MHNLVQCLYLYKDFTPSSLFHMSCVRSTIYQKLKIPKKICPHNECVKT